MSRRKKQAKRIESNIGKIRQTNRQWNRFSPKRDRERIEQLSLILEILDKNRTGSKATNRVGIVPKSDSCGNMIPQNESSHGPEDFPNKEQIKASA